MNGAATESNTEPPAVGRAPVQVRAALQEFPPRAVARSWPATTWTRGQVLSRLSSPPFLTGDASHRDRRLVGVSLLLDWLTEQPGLTWQQRWQHDEPALSGQGWKRTRDGWLAQRDRPLSWHSDFLSIGLRVAISADIVRPSLRWLLSGAHGRGALVRTLALTRDPTGFARLSAHCTASPDVSALAATRTHYLSAVVMAAKGGTLADITVGDVVEALDTRVEGFTSRRGISGGSTLVYRMLRESGILGDQAPPTLRHLRTGGQRSTEQMIDRYDIRCLPVRDLLVDYLNERRAALDYNSVQTLANSLGNRFWADLEAHHPGIDSLHLSKEVSNAWKQRLRTKPAIVTSATGASTEVHLERMSYRECLTPVRAFYLDLAHWAVEDPQRWAAWVAPCPIGDSEIDLRKGTRQRKARMDTRTRARLPQLPALAAAVAHRHRQAAELLHAARQARPGEEFTVHGSTFTRRARSTGVWAQEGSSPKRDLQQQEERAFWAWAIIEVLRATGVRVEELLELTHHSLVQYRLPSTGALVPLLQIAPSKTDAERLLVVSPELAEVLSTIIRRVRGSAATLPLVSAYDDYERQWMPPAPRLFQRPVNTENRAIAHSSLLQILTAAARDSGLVDHVEGRPLHYTPHDFRRMFITDAIMNGLPPHIAQIIAGHQDIRVTMGYKAVYPDEAIQAHLAFLARRRSLRPSEEYRTPTEDEWQEFLGHFERRKVATGTCARAFSTPCLHEHACIRCPMLWPDPAQRDRLVDIRDNLIARINEAEREAWLGDVDGLQLSLAGAEDKLAQLDRQSDQHKTVDLGMPTR